MSSHLEPRDDHLSSSTSSLGNVRGAPCPDVRGESVYPLASIPYMERSVPFGPVRPASSGRPPEEFVGLLG